MPNFYEVNSAPINSQGEEFYIPQTGSGTIVSIEQEVQAKGTGTIVSIEQNVKVNDSDHLARTGWDLLLHIGGVEIPKNEIHGQVNVIRTEGTAALMEVTLIPGSGVQDLDSYAGKSVTLDAETSSGTTRLFTGIVDIPEVNIIEKKITLRCTDKRTEQINSQFASNVSSIGYFSPLLFPNVEDTAQELEFRLSTVPFAVDFDAYGNYTVTPWEAKTTPDFTLTDSDVYYFTPQVFFNSRGRVTNQVKINLNYRYNKLFHMERNFSWTSPIASGIDKLLIDGYSLTFRDMVRAAAEAAGWPIRGGIQFTPIFESGWYNVRGTDIAFSTLQLQIESVDTGVTDSNGNTIYEHKRIGGTDYASLYCMGAQWTGTTRWAQTVSENYTINVNAPQSQTQYGTITEETNIGIQSDFDDAGWEDYQYYTDTGNGSNTYTINKDTNRSEFELATIAALNRAKTTILNSHRDTRVLVSRFLWPEVDLKHTVYVDTDEVEAKGKVYQIRHRIDIGTGEAVTDVTLILSRRAGASVSESSLVAPSAPSYSPDIPSSTIFLGNHFGEDPTTPEAASWNGMVGNRWTIENNNKFRTTYQEQFIVDTPAVPDSIRQEKVLPSSQSYDVNIPNDLLVVTF